MAKIINDKFGHNEGDRALKAAGDIMTEAFRNADIIARIGGDEFTVLLGSAGKKHIPMLRERIDRETEKMNNTLGKPYKITLSLGFASYRQYSNSNLRDLMDLADQELYLEKRLRYKQKNSDSQQEGVR